MSRVRDWVIAAAVLAIGRMRPARGGRPGPAGDPDRRAETWVIVLFALAALCAGGFVAVYFVHGVPDRTQFLGLALGLAFLLLGAAGVVTGERLVVTEELEEDYPAEEHPDEQQQLVLQIEEGAPRLSRKRLVAASGAAAAGALGLAALTPAVSLGPVFEIAPYYRSGWRRGRRLVDGDGRPYLASDIREATFYTAFPEHGPRDEDWAPLVVVRLPESQLRLPRSRRTWAPRGIVAYSKICTHAGCAISLYRTPRFAPVEKEPALVCPCHYSTFDPATGGNVLFGPAGRPLPQLPLEIAADGTLRAAGNFDGPVGPSWWGVRMRKPQP